jgi:hypothetical protein
MEILSKSLHHANMVFVFQPEKFSQPDNSELVSIYRGEQAAGANLVDDSTLKMKILDLPRLKIQMVLEPDRLIVEDNSQAETSPLVREAAYIYWRLFKDKKLTGFGFNFDVYYRSRDFIDIRNLFQKSAAAEILNGRDLLDWGTQFTLSRNGGESREQYIFKVVSPMELMLRLNWHFPARELPILPRESGAEEELAAEKILPLQRIFSRCYEEAEEVVRRLDF